VDELTACELLPFEAAAEVGPHAVMVGHIVVPELTGDLPATLCADAIALVTEWKQFRLPDWNVVRQAMRGNLIVDGRNIYDRNELRNKGFAYTRIGNKQ